MRGKLQLRLGVAAALAAGALLAAPTPAWAQEAGIVALSDDVHAGELQVPVNKSQVLKSDRPYAKALIGNPDIADVLPLTSQSLYVLGKKAGTTSLTLYDKGNRLIAVVDVVVGPDVISLRRQYGDSLKGSDVSARISNDSIILEGVVPNAVEADRAVQIAETYAPGKVVNLLSIGSSQQVMLDVRFAEVKRSALKQIGVSWFGSSCSTPPCQLGGAIGNGAGISGNGPPTLDAIAGSFAVISRTFRAFGENFNVTLDALERKGVITTLAEPTLVALSGETASFLAGGEFPIPVIQSGNGGGSNSITVEFKPFGVSLAFTPTVLADGVINMVVQPEVSSIDPSASVSIGNQTIPGLSTRRAKTVLELRDGESFAMAGLIRKDFSSTIRQVPLLGSLPIIGTLFRSNGFQNDQTELVIIVTPRLVRPVPAGQIRLPTDRVQPPSELDLFMRGRTDKAIGTNPFDPNEPPKDGPKPTPPAGGFSGPNGYAPQR